MDETAAGPARSESEDRERPRWEARTSEQPRTRLKSVDVRAVQLETVLNQVADAVFVFSRDGRLTDANEAAARLVGYPSVHALLEVPHEKVMEPFEVLDESGQPLPTEQLPSRRALRGEGTSAVLVRYRERASGDERWSLVSAKPIVDENGQIPFVVTIIRDITERRHSEQALRFLAEAGMILAPSLDFAVTLQQLAHLIVPFLADACIIDVLEGDVIRRLATAHANPAGQALIEQLHAFPPDRNKSHPVFHALHHGESELGPTLPDSLLVTISHNSRHLEILRQLHPRSYMVVPLQARGRILGTITFWITESGRRYCPTDLSLAKDLARRAALAIDNARLFQSEQEARAVADRARSRTSQLQAVTDGLAESLTSRNVAGVMTTEGIKVLDAEEGWVAQISADNARLEIINAAGDAREALGPSGHIPIEAPIPLAAARSRTPILLRSRDDFTRYPAIDRLVAWRSDRALAVVPLAAEGRILGVLGLSFPASRELTDDDLGLMSTLAQECGQALERARLYEAERAARAAAEANGRRLACLAEASRILSTSLNYEQTLTHLAQIAVPQLADWCAVDVLAEDETVVRLAVAHVDEDKVQWARHLSERYPFDPESPRGLARVLRTGEPKLYADIPDAMLAESARDAEHLAILRRVGFTSAMIVPLRARERILGAISFVSAESRRHYGPADLEFVMDLAGRAAVAVDNARLYRDAQRAIRDREEFISIASHELKTPLTTVKSYSQILSTRIRKPDADPSRLRYLTDRLEEQVHRLEILIADLLDASRIRQGRLDIVPEPFDLVELGQEVLARFEDAPGRSPDHTLILDAPETVVGVWDPARLDQVLTNLVSNALKYSPEGGEVRLRLRRYDQDVELAVSDQGIGISPEEQARLYQPFIRTARSGEVASGQGLGLFITAQIVKAHAGTIEIESQEGRGTTFSIRLPLSR